ncbi:MAG: ribonuclease E/G [Defluviicoccus sp.]|nr:MAG: ribonuclease E/G [Defluviicoccus sp.]
MPIDEVLISSYAGTACAAGRERGMLVALALDVDDLRVCDVFLGRVSRRVPAMGGAFVDIGQRRSGLLMAADAADGRLPSDGETVVVQVLRVAEGDKGPKLTGKLTGKLTEEIPGNFNARLADTTLGDLASVLASGPIPRRLARGPDAIEALLQHADAGGALRSIVVDDPARLVRLRATWPALASRLQPWRGQASLFEAEGVSEAIEAALSPRVPLPGGGKLIIEETAAVVAIDVDLGSEAGSSAKAAALACNQHAAAAIGREVRLRDLAGRIVIDFIPVRRPAERAKILAALQAVLDDGERALKIGGWTRTGLVELTREKRGPSLASRLLGVCPACAGCGRVHAPQQPTDPLLPMSGEQR